MQHKVLDTSGILRTSLDFSDSVYYITNSVLQELQDENARIAIESAIKSGSVVVRDPSIEFLKRVKRAAEKTGDIGKLSETDIDIIALALERNLIIVTDDYGIQNVASLLGLSYETVSQEGIGMRVKWIMFCKACNSEYSTNKEFCDICGSELRRKSSGI
ncbi:MAG TPA: hypothetical protein EYP86_00030 [Candidatus Altiarchaeales archaeon]|nr:hypothetical protein [Candidatus Altiarchaeales archaeon]